MKINLGAFVQNCMLKMFLGFVNSVFFLFIQNISYSYIFILLVFVLYLRTNQLKFIFNSYHRNAGFWKTRFSLDTHPVRLNPSRPLGRSLAPITSQIDELLRVAVKSLS